MRRSGDATSREPTHRVVLHLPTPSTWATLMSARLKAPYGHVDPERHESAAAGLDRHLDV